MKLILRILTLLSYCLPFIFFADTGTLIDTKTAFNLQDSRPNRQEVITYEQQKHWRDSVTALENNDTLRPQISVAIARDTPNKVLPTTAQKQADVSNDTVNKSTSEHLRSWFYSAWQHLKSPAEASLSGIGTIYAHNNIIGKLLLACSFILSLILLFTVRITTTSKLKSLLFASDLFCLIAFMTISLFSSISLLWGFWTTLILLFIQLYTETVGPKSSK